MTSKGDEVTMLVTVAGSPSTARITAGNTATSRKTRMLWLAATLRMSAPVSEASAST